MAKTIIRRATGRFTICPNDLVRDESLSDTAVRIYLVLASFGEEFEYSPSLLAKYVSAGKDKRLSCFKELKEAGWITKEQTRGADGTFAQTVFTLHNTPVAFSPQPDLPTTAEPPTADQTSAIYIEEKEKEEKNKESIFSVYPFHKVNKRKTLEVLQKVGKNEFDPNLIEGIKSVKDTGILDGEFAPWLSHFVESNHDKVFIVEHDMTAAERNQEISRLQELTFSHLCDKYPEKGFTPVEINEAVIKAVRVLDKHPTWSVWQEDPDEWDAALLQELEKELKLNKTS